MRLHGFFLLWLVVAAASGCVGGARARGASHPASSNASPTPLSPVALAITREDDPTPTTDEHAHHRHGHAGHTMPSSAEHAHE
jgi:hypothetical protein